MLKNIRFLECARELTEGREGVDAVVAADLCEPVCGVAHKVCSTGHEESLGSSIKGQGGHGPICVSLCATWRARCALIALE